jgi:hypothetical protein
VGISESDIIVKIATLEEAVRNLKECLVDLRNEHRLLAQEVNKKGEEINHIFNIAEAVKIDLERLIDKYEQDISNLKDKLVLCEDHVKVEEVLEKDHMPNRKVKLTKWQAVLTLLLLAIALASQFGWFH